MAGNRGLRYRLLTPTEREWVLARLAVGERAVDVAAVFGVSGMTVYRVRDAAVLARRRVAHSPHRLSFVERERISRGIAAGETGREIARVLGRSPSTVCREIRAGGGRRWYRAVKAERRAQRCARRPKATKLSGCARLVAEIERGLELGWSPQQISARLRVEFPDDPVMRISHETIYLSLYVQSRGELRRQLTAELRSARTARKSQGQAQKRGRIIDMINISERPAEVQDRAVPGHWEGDLICGAHNRSAIATLVERQTRYVMLAYLGADRSTAGVIEALKGQITGLPEHLKRSLTWDQGPELAAHKQFTVDTGVKVFFCDPHSPWQRGSNENTNGLLRQYLPKSTDLAVHDQGELDRIAAQLNGRPRQTLGWMNPAEKMTELLTGTLPTPTRRS
jgi:transposase, IS30 family